MRFLSTHFPTFDHELYLVHLQLEDHFKLLPWPQGKKMGELGRLTAFEKTMTLEYGKQLLHPKDIGQTGLKKCPASTI